MDINSSAVSPLRVAEYPWRASARDNNFGALRLALAVVVIFSHSPELVDGNRSREPLTRAFGTLTFSECSVLGFFLISGFLITKSWFSSRGWAHYLAKRVLRIYPGYLAAYVPVLLIVGPLAGGELQVLLGREGLVAIGRAALLLAPLLPGTFPGLPFPQLNSAVWTIAYEFRCYLLLLVLGVSGLLPHRGAIAALTAALLLAWALNVRLDLPPAVVAVTGRLQTDIGFFAVFCCGALFYLYRDRIRYHGWAAVLAMIALLPLMTVYRLTGPALAVLGGYILFWFALAVPSERLARIGFPVDLSYGTYLYAWPLQSLLIWSYPGISPWTVFPVATLLSMGLAYVSWRAIEGPALRLKRLVP